MMAKTVIILLTGTLFFSCQTVSSISLETEFSWLIGKWKSQIRGEPIYEEWKAVYADKLSAESYQIFDDKKYLLILGEKNKNLYLSSRNLQNSKVITLSELNTYEIMNASALCFLESSLDVLQKND